MNCVDFQNMIGLTVCRPPIKYALDMAVLLSV